MTENNDDGGSGNRILGVVSGISWNVNNMVGVGIFVTPGIVWQSMGSPGAALMVWIGGAMITLCASLCYTDLGTRISEQGGELIYLHEAFPKPHKLAGFLFSFMFFFAIQVGIIGAVSQAFAQYLVYSFSTSDFCTRYSQINPRNGWNFWILKFIAIGSLLLVTTYHVFSNKLANKINEILASIKIFTLFTVAIIGLANLKSTYNNWGSFFDGTTLTISSFSTSLISVLFSYYGWNNLNYSLSEFRKPEYRLAYSNVISVIIVSTLYILVNVAFISVVPSEHAKNPGYAFNEVIAGYFAENVWNRQFGQALSFFVAVSAFGTLGALVWSGSRVVQAAAAKGYFPIIAEKLKLKEHNENFKTPMNALIIQFLWCTVIIIIIGGSITSDPFKILSDFSQYSAWIFYGLTGVGLIFLKRRTSNKYFSVRWIVVFIFIICSLYITIFSFIDDSSDSNNTSNNNNSSIIQQCNLTKPPTSPHYLPFVMSLCFLGIGLIVWFILSRFYNDFFANN